MLEQLNQAHEIYKANFLLSERNFNTAAGALRHAHMKFFRIGQIDTRMRFAFWVLRERLIERAGIAEILPS